MPTHYLDGPLEQTRGVIGRYPAENERYVFRFDTAKQRGVHMIGVRRPLRVRWRLDDRVVADRVLRPWIGWARYRCDSIVETKP